MYIVILGAGRVGVRLAKQLIAEKKNVAIIERNSTVAKDAARTLDCLIVNDEGNNPESLKKARIEKADVFVSLAGLDETNLVACALASAEYKNIITIARVRNLDYSRTRMLNNSFPGIDYVINPEIEAAHAISYAIKHGARSDIILFDNTQFEMRNLVVKEGSLFCNKRLKALRMEIDYEFLVAGIMRDDLFFIPTGSSVIEEGDLLYILSTEKGFEAIFKKVFKEKSDINRILLVGGNRIGTYIADRVLRDNPFKLPLFDKIPFLKNSGLGKLLNKGRKHLHIVEKDFDRCKELSEKYPQALVIHADVTEDYFQEESFLSEIDLIITATEKQELNLITALYAKTLGVPKAMALVTRSSYRTMSLNLDLDMVVCINDTVVNSVMKIIRKGNIENVHALTGGHFEVIEFNIISSSPVAEKAVVQIPLPEGSLILFISRHGEDIIPSGETIIHKGDRLVMILNKKHITKIETIISG